MSLNVASLTASLICFAAEHLLRTDPEDGLEGFFIALFVRKEVGGTSEEPSEDATVEVRTKQVRQRRNGVRAFSSLRLSRMILW
jgi:putative methyltransferase